METYFEDLPIECQTCINLGCGAIYMDGHGYYWCRKVICFWKYKEEPCPCRIMETE